MKTFKQHLIEGSGYSSTEQGYEDYDTSPHMENAVDALNSYVGSIVMRDVLNPTLAVHRLQTQLHKFGYHFEMNALDKEGTTMLPLKYGSGTFHVERGENPMGEFVEEDGISNHIEGGISLMVTVTPTRNGKSMVEAEIVRNRDMSDTE